MVIIQKISLPGNLKFYYSGISQSLKLRISLEKILSISLELNFTPNTLGCYGLKAIRKVRQKSVISSKIKFIKSS